jgi:glycosyltransferase involved in cell wall biosynthesis
LSNKIFDYLGNGCPVVFGGDGDTADLLGQANAGIVVDPENPDALAKAIISLYNNPDTRKIMGQNGRQHILRFYTREKLLKKLEKMMLSIK